MRELRMKKCDCGYGGLWFHYGEESIHELNLGTSATAKCYKIRKPIGDFFGHMDEKHVVASYKEEHKSFHYKNYMGTSDEKRKQARCDSAKWVDTQAKKEVIQIGLFC